MENAGRTSLHDSIGSSTDVMDSSTYTMDTTTPNSTDRQNSVATNRTYTIAKHVSCVDSECSKIRKSKDSSTDRQMSVATNKTFTIAEEYMYSRKELEFSDEKKLRDEEKYYNEYHNDEKIPASPEMHPEAADLQRHKLGFTPPLERPKNAAVNSRGIIQELRREGFLGCATPLIPRNIRQTKSGVSFEYFFRPNRMAPRLLPRLRSDGKVGASLGQRVELPRRESPLKKTSFRRKSPVKHFCRRHTGSRVSTERRRIQRDIQENRATQEKDDWNLIGRFWQELRQRKENERIEDEARRLRERKILNEQMGRNSKDPLP